MECFLGTISAFGFNFAPYGWAQCGGQLMNIQQNTALFAVICTFYGGNGTSSFGLPNLQGRAVLGMGTNAYGNYDNGETGGVENVQINAANYPGHTHNVLFALNANSAGTTNPIATSQFPGISPASGGGHGTGANDLYSSAATPNVNMANPTLAIANAGTGAALPFNLDTRRPFLAINYCIALEGVYPTRE